MKGKREKQGKPRSAIAACVSEARAGKRCCCHQCRHEWTARMDGPRYCPRCKRRWDFQEPTSCKPFRYGDGDWTEYRALPNLREVDFHYSEDGPRYSEYCVAMAGVRGTALRALREAQNAGSQYVMFRHGYSTSRRGATTARSVVRSLVRSPEATPYIIRRECIQHWSVFVAAIRSRSPR